METQEKRPEQVVSVHEPSIEFQLNLIWIFSAVVTSEFLHCIAEFSNDKFNLLQASQMSKLKVHIRKSVKLKEIW